MTAAGKGYEISRHKSLNLGLAYGKRVIFLRNLRLKSGVSMGNTVAWFGNLSSLSPTNLCAATNCSEWIRDVAYFHIHRDRSYRCSHEGSRKSCYHTSTPRINETHKSRPVSRCSCWATVPPPHVVPSRDEGWQLHTINIKSRTYLRMIDKHIHHSRPWALKSCADDPRSHMNLGVFVQRRCCEGSVSCKPSKNRLCSKMRLSLSLHVSLR